jgi:hypothetical protein
MAGPVNVSDTDPLIPTTIMGSPIMGGIRGIGRPPADQIIKILFGIPMGVYVNGPLLSCHLFLLSDYF